MVEKFSKSETKKGTFVNPLPNFYFSANVRRYSVTAI